jgi:hypothetical protein
MILTITIDTHPHTNALIEGQVKRTVEDLLRARRLGAVTKVKAEFDPSEAVEAVELAKAEIVTLKKRAANLLAMVIAEKPLPEITTSVEGIDFFNAESYLDTALERLKALGD